MIDYKKQHSNIFIPSLISYIIFIVLASFSLMAGAEDLSGIVNLALEVDGTYKQAEENMHAAMELIPQARADLLPILAATANTNYAHTNNPSIGSYNSFAYGVTLSQPIFNLSNWFKYQQAGAQVKAAIANYEDAKQDLILRVTEQYFNILKAMEDLSFSRLECKTFTQYLLQTEQRFSAGVIAITDVHEAKAKYDTTAAQEIAAENEVMNQKEILARMIGITVGDIYVPQWEFNLKRPDPNDIESWVQNALVQNYALQSRRFEVESVKINRDIQKSDHYPTLNVNGSIMRGKLLPPPSQVIANNNTIGITLNIPLFNSGKVNAKTRQAAHEYAAAKELMLDAERQVSSNVRQSFRTIVTQISQIEALKQSVVSSKIALEATEAAFTAGTRTIIEVLSSQSDMLNAKRNLHKTRFDYILTNFKLKRFAGILAIQDVNLINGWIYAN